MFNKSMGLSVAGRILVLFLATFSAVNAHAGNRVLGSGPLVKREERRSVVSTECGEISDVRIRDDVNGGTYLLQFFTLEPHSLFLPVILHADMVFYVHSGRGKLSWTEEDDLKRTQIKQGDVYRLEQGSVFFVDSVDETDQAEPQKLRIHAIFAKSEEDLHEPVIGPYSSIRDMIIGFDRRVLQATFQVSDDVIEELLNGTKPPAIVPGNTQFSQSERRTWEIEDRYITSLLSGRSYNIFESNKKKKRKESAKLFNLLEEDKDFENCNGWSTTVTKKKLSALKGSHFGLFMVNLTEGSMMSPHWNPMATEIAIVLQGQGMVRVVCSSLYDDTECQKIRFKVDEGDVFSVPRFHSMAQMSFNNDTFVFVGFSTSTKKNHPQFLAGQASVLRVLDRDVLAASFNTTKQTIDQFVSSRDDSVILKCTNCAEEEFWKMGEGEREREGEEEEKEKEERQREQREQEVERVREKEREKEGGGDEDPTGGRGGGAPGGETPVGPESHWVSRITWSKG
ncbi:vicilin-like antimicrobial peptides 2-2-like [Dorcoceras hygrometricum]|uniref:Vicilin-like antimicrobial peptides 2-2-like n=1 Tax=Dorcoceras hygrometricum TaxID=472368 RepID=A0A2Z7C8Q7_9LAMI|nr:vicilin-like antimicrobial peptides 2-2-like [Dorcoceras hygrometricum]